MFWDPIIGVLDSGESAKTSLRLKKKVSEGLKGENELIGKMQEGKGLQTHGLVCAKALMQEETMQVWGLQIKVRAEDAGHGT